MSEYAHNKKLTIFFSETPPCKGIMNSHAHISISGGPVYKYIWLHQEWMFETRAKGKTAKQTTPTAQNAKHRVLSSHTSARELSEKYHWSTTWIFQQLGIAWTFTEPLYTLRYLLVHPKDKTKNHQKCGVIFLISWISCSDCDEAYQSQLLYNLCILYLQFRLQMCAVFGTW